MIKNAYQIVSGVFQNAALMLAGTHAGANVYQRSIGAPDVTFDANSLDFKLNVPGLVATDSAANVIVAMRNPYGMDGNPEAYVDALVSLAGEPGCIPLTDEELFVAMNFANATWRTTQYIKSPDKWARPVNRSFMLLDKTERDKDVAQLEKYAAYLLSVIRAA